MTSNSLISSPRETAGAFSRRTARDGSGSAPSVPSHHPIPTDGPVGTLLAATHRHPYRPAHTHFLLRAVDHETITTQIFVNGSRHLDNDTAFVVKHSLIVDFNQINDAALADAHDVSLPAWHAHVEFVLAASAR